MPAPKKATLKQLKILNCWSPYSNYQSNVAFAVANNHGTRKYVQDTFNAFLSGDLVPPKLFDSSDREKKRALYQELVKAHLEHLGGSPNDLPCATKYVGLTAGYCAEMKELLGSYNDVEIFHVIEQNVDVYNYLNLYAQNIMCGVSYEKADIWHGDIIEHLDTRSNNVKYNLYDLDLMCHLSAGLIEVLPELINRTAESKAAINLVTSYGHGLTTEKHQERCQLFKQELGRFFRIDQYKTGSYQDRRIPMGFQHILISRT